MKAQESSLLKVTFRKWVETCAILSLDSPTLFLSEPLLWDLNPAPGSHICTLNHYTMMLLFVLLSVRAGVPTTPSIMLMKPMNIASFQMPPHQEWLWKKSFLSTYYHGFFTESLKREVVLSA